MATTPFDHNTHPASIFNIYNDSNVTPPSPSVPMPSGPCNFVDVSLGAQSAKCGCRRFWARSALGASPDQNEHCMCSHHACFHDDTRTGATPTPEMTPAPGPGRGPGQENEKPPSNRDPLTPVVDISHRMPSIAVAHPPHTAHASHSRPSTMDMMAPLALTPALPASTGTIRTQEFPPRTISVASVHDQSIPDTMSWGFLPPPPAAAALPPIPSQCLMASQASSATSSVRRHLRPFAGTGLDTLRAGLSKQKRSPLQNREMAPADAATNSVPSVADTNPEDTDQEPHRSPEPMDSQQLQPAQGPTRDAFMRLSDTVNGQEQRIDRLENVSFSAINHEECNEKHENTDLRITDLEVRLEEAERMMNDGGDSSSRSNRQQVDESISSVASVSTSNSHITARQPDNTDLYSEIQALQSQVNQLQSLAPSFGNPWEIEVVFLPFALRGIWLDASEFNSQRLSMPPEQIAQLPSTNSAFASSFQSQPLQEWAPDDPTSDWLLPRACAPDRLIDKRLRSRGLIRKVAIKGPDARSVQVAVANTFGNLFQSFSSPSAPRYGSTHHHSADARRNRFFGLNQPWVPLRKIHKDSQLRFLSPSEMITPAVWDVAFLSTNVVMKATAIHRLFVTQPGAYLQDPESYETGWCWQQVREMSRHYSESQDAERVPEADALEECWEWNSKLDEVPTPDSSQQSSLSRRQSGGLGRQVAESQTTQFYTGKEFPSMSTSRSGLQQQGQQGDFSRKTPAKLSSIRTSLPPSALDVMSPAMRRRITSPAWERRMTSSPAPRAMSMAVSKRRQGTRSPSVMNTGGGMRVGRGNVNVGGTPRWGTSPSPAGVDGAHFYATPYSIYDARRGVSMAPSAAGGSGVGGGMGQQRQQEQDRERERQQREYYAQQPQQGQRRQSLLSLADDEEEMGDGNGSTTDPCDNDGDTDMTHDDENEPWPAQQDHQHQPIYQRQHVELSAMGHYHHPPNNDGTIRVYQDATGGGGGGGMGGGLGGGGAMRQPEDEPWPGLPDNPMSDSENIDPLSGTRAGEYDSDDHNHDHDDDENVNDENRPVTDRNRESQASSVPSEYPSTQSAWRGPEAVSGVGVGGSREGAASRAPSAVGGGSAPGVDFEIHVDGE